MPYVLLDRDDLTTEQIWASLSYQLLVVWSVVLSASCVAYGWVPFQISVPKELVALMSANRDGEAPDPEDSAHKVYSFSQNVSALRWEMAAQGVLPDLCSSQPPQVWFGSHGYHEISHEALWNSRSEKTASKGWCWWCLLVFFGIPRKAKFEF